MVGSFQRRAVRWAIECFGLKKVGDKKHRVKRFLEEALELAQASGCLDRPEAYAMVDYVYNRPKGVLRQELGGTVHTLAVLADTFNLDMMECGEFALADATARIAQIREKEKSKP